MRIWLAGIAAVFLLLSAPPPSAQADELRFYYCFVPDTASGFVFLSKTAPVGPVSERRHYGTNFLDGLIQQKLAQPNAPAYCVMRPTMAEIDVSKANLRKDCNDCGTARIFRDVDFFGANPSLANDASSGTRANSGKPSPSPPMLAGPAVPSADKSASARDSGQRAPERSADEIPFEVAAPLPSSVYIKLIPNYENAFVQVHYRFYLCGQDIYVSYSLRPVPTRGVNEIRLNASITGNHMKPHFLLETAREVTGHQLGCAFQKRKIATLAEFADQVKPATTDWTRLQLIEQLLDRFSMFASGSPWPPGSQYSGHTMPKH